MAESLLNHHGQGQFHAYSAGLRPRGEVDADTLALLTHLDLPTAGLRSKALEEFCTPDAPHMDLVFSVSDEQSGEDLPQLPGQPITGHWHIPDPLSCHDAPARHQALHEALRALESHIRLLLCLRPAALEHLKHVA